MGDWWYLESLRKEREANELRKQLEEMERARQRQEDLEFKIEMARFNNQEFLSDKLYAMWDEVRDYCEITDFTNGIITMNYEVMDSEPDENGYDVYLAAMDIVFRLEDIEDIFEFYGLNVDKLQEIYDELGTTVKFDMEQFSVFMRKELSKYSDTIIE